MITLESLIELNKLENENRKNRLEDKLIKQEFFGEIGEFFDPVTKTSNTNSDALLANSEAMQGLQNRT